MFFLLGYFSLQSPRSIHCIVIRFRSVLMMLCLIPKMEMGGPTLSGSSAIANCIKAFAAVTESSFFLQSGCDCLYRAIKSPLDPTTTITGSTVPS